MPVSGPVMFAFAFATIAAHPRFFPSASKQLSNIGDGKPEKHEMRSRPVGRTAEFVDPPR